MIRLKNSFKSAVVLLERGYFVEIPSLYRLIYEQLAWSCFVLEQDNVEVIKKDGNVTKSVKDLKRCIGDKYGSLYGELSKNAHLDVDVIGKYCEVNECGTLVKGRSGEMAKEETLTLVLLFKMFIEVLKYAFHEHFNLDEIDRRYYNEFLMCQCKIWNVINENWNDDKSQLTKDEDGRV